MRQTKANTKMLRFCFFFLLLLLSAGGSGPHGGYWFDNAQEDTDFGVGKPENVEFTKTVKTFDEDEDDLTSKKLGSYKLVFLRGNLVGMDHPVPAVAEALLSVHCSLPSSVVLIVDEPVLQSNPVIHTGTWLDFSIAGADHQVSGKWVTSNRSVLSVNVASKAISQGSAHGHRLKLQTKVTRLLGNTIDVGSPRETLTNVHVPAGGYTFPVKFRMNKFLVSENGNKATFNCQVDPPFIGYAKPWTDFDSGNMYCLFFPFSPEYLVHSMPTAKDVQPFVFFSVKASVNQVSGSAAALLIGGFSVTSSYKLNLNPDSNTNTISILGNTDVEIHLSNKGRLSISLIKRDDFGIAGRALYKVNVLRSEQFTDKILVTLPATGQSVEIDVSYDTGESLATSSKVTDSVLFLILVLVSSVSAVVYILMKVIDRLDPVRPTALYGGIVGNAKKNKVGRGRL